jgi:hypothetical protein
LNDPDLNDTFDPETEKSAVAQLQAKRESDEKTARIILENRKGAYTRVFLEGVPSMEDRKIVMADLHRFCRHGSTTYAENERTHCLLTGRQEVTLRIDDFTRLSVDALLEKYTGAKET